MVVVMRAKNRIPEEPETRTRSLQPRHRESVRLSPPGARPLEVNWCARMRAIGRGEGRHCRRGLTLLPITHPSVDIDANSYHSGSNYSELNPSRRSFGACWLAIAAKLVLDSENELPLAESVRVEALPRLRLRASI